MSILKADALQGKTAAGDIDVTSEGGAATMQLQQGLAKMWCLWNQESTVSIRDSFNAASLTDNGTGKGQVNLSLAMNNSTYSYAGHHSDIGGGYVTTVINNTSYQAVNSTTQFRVSMLNGDGYQDSKYCGYSVLGDLA